MDRINTMSPSSSTHTHTHRQELKLKFPSVPPDHAHESCLIDETLFLTSSRSWCGAGLCYLNTVLLALSSMTRFHFYTPGMAAPHTHFVTLAAPSARPPVLGSAWPGASHPTRHMSYRFMAFPWPAHSCRIPDQKFILISCLLLLDVTVRLKLAWTVVSDWLMCFNSSANLSKKKKNFLQMGLW